MSLVGEKEGGQRIQQGECLERNEGRARSASYFPCSRLEERSKHSQVTSVPPPINSAGIVNPVAGGVILIVGSLPRSRKLAIDDEGCSSPCDASSSVAESSMLPSSSTLASGSRAASEKHQEAKLAKFRSEEERDDSRDNFLPPKPRRVSVPKNETEFRLDCFRSSSLASSTSEVGPSSSPTETSSKTFWKLEREREGENGQLELSSSSKRAKNEERLTGGQAQRRLQRGYRG